MRKSKILNGCRCAAPPRDVRPPCVGSDTTNTAKHAPREAGSGFGAEPQEELSPDGVEGLPPCGADQLAEACDRDGTDGFAHGPARPVQAAGVAEASGGSAAGVFWRR